MNNESSLVLTDERFVASIDSFILVYKLNNYILQKLFEFQCKEYFTCLYEMIQLKNGLVVGRSYDSIHHQSFINILYISSNTVLVIDKVEISETMNYITELSQERLAFNDNNTFITVYNGIRPYNKMFSINVQLEIIQMNEIKRNRLIVLVITGQLQIWNMYSRAAETIIDNFNCTCILQSSRHNIIIGGDNFISELNLNNYQIISNTKI